MRNSKELERFAFGIHATTAAAYGVIAVACGALLVCHELGRRYNKARSNHFERRFHTAGLIWAATAIGVDTLAAVSHRRAAAAQEDV